MRYFNGYISYGLEYENGRTTLSDFVDVNYASDTLETNSASGYIFIMGNEACVCGCKNLSIVSFSTCEEEYNLCLRMHKKDLDEVLDE